MNVISEAGACLVSGSLEMSAVLCTDSSDVGTVALSVPCFGKISCGCHGALSTTDVTCSSFLKATTSWKLVF